jgi:hypothetical protein
MATTSKFLQLDPQILVEYIYSDPSSPDTIETDANGAKILVLENSYVGANHIFTEDNPYVETGNYRYRSVIPVTSNKSQYAYLTNKNVVNYLDADVNLPDVNTLLAQESTLPNVPVKNPAYDTIRIHLVSGYTFEGLGEGFIFEAFLRDRNNNRHSLTSITYRPSDNFETLNPKPFIIGEKLYSKYIDIKVLAAAWLTDEYFIDKTNSSSLAWITTDGNGLPAQNTIELNLKYIAKTEILNGQTYFYPGESSRASVSLRDEYSGLYAVIEESATGDFFDLYGAYNGDIFEDFILELNGQPDTDISVIHDIQVLEQVGTNFTKTSEQSFIQSDDFGSPYRFRPIIFNSHIATSYRILYTVRLLNKVDNSQIIRTVQYSSFDVKKYGRRFRKINLGVVPNITKVYNSLPSETQEIVLNNDVSFSLNGEAGASIIKQTEFVLGFKESIKISASATSVKTTPAVNEEGDIIPTAQGGEVKPGDVPLKLKSTSGTNKVYPQNEARIIVSPFDDFIKFVFYDNSVQEATGASEPQLLDLSDVGKLYMSFYDSETNDEVRVENYTNISGLNPAQGEVVFKINKEQSKKVLGFNSREFYVSSRLEIGEDKSDETLLYTGKWLRPEDKYSENASEVIETLNDANVDLSNKLKAEKDASATMITDLENEIKRLRAENKTFKNKIVELNLSVEDLTDDISSVNSLLEKERNSKEIENLLTELSSTKPTPENKKDDKSSIKKANMLSKIKKGKANKVSTKEYEQRKGKSAKNIKFRP